MAIITLTTDFGTRDYTVASVKGAILKQNSQTHVVDITHQITPFSISEAAYVVKNAYPHFPMGSIHILAIDALPSKHQRLIAAEIDSHYFICADNGVLSLIAQEINPTQVVEIQLNRYELNNFPTREIMVPIACHIARGGELNVVGRAIDDYKVLQHLQPQYKEPNTLIGSVIYIDHFGNIITNINQKKFQEFGKGRAYEIKVRNQSFQKILHQYNDVVKNYEKEVEYHGERLALFNSAGYLEIAVYKSDVTRDGGAASLFGMRLGDVVSINFTD